MTNEELNERFSLLADSVSRVADASTNGIRQLVENSALRDERIRQLVDGQLALQRLGGQLSEIVLESREETRRLRLEHEEEARRLRLEHEEEARQFRQRQEESDQRFDVLLQEIRYLIRRKDPGAP